MLTPTRSYIEYNLNCVLAEFACNTGWENLSLGEWNGRYDKDVSFRVEYCERDLFQHEQDYVVFNDRQDDIRDKKPTLETMQQDFPWKEFRGNRYLYLPFAIIVEYLRDHGILPRVPLLFRN